MAWMDVVALAHECRNARELGARILEGFRAEIGLDVGFVIGADVSTHALGDDHAFRATTNAAYERELSPLKATALASRGVATDTEVFGRSRFSMRWFRDLAAPVGGKHTLVAYTRARGAVTGLVMLGRCSDAPFSHADVARVEASLPAISLAAAAFGASPKPVSLAPLSLADRLFSRARDGELTVRDRGPHREMLANELVWTRASRADAARSGWPYIDLLALGGVLARDRRRALVIGCGGGVLVHLLERLFPAMQLEVVERDPRVAALARRYFALRAPVRVADGARVVAEASPRSWDAIFVDAYDACADAPAIDATHLFTHAARVLTPGGAVAFNVIGDLAGDAVLEVTTAALASFDDVRVVPVVDPGEAMAPHARRNVVVLAR